MYYNYLCIQIDHLLSVTLGMMIKCDGTSHFCRGRINSLFNMEKSVQQYKQAVRVIKDAILYSQYRAAKLVTGEELSLSLQKCSPMASEINREEFLGISFSHHMEILHKTKDLHEILLDSNEIRQLRDVCIFEVNGIEVYM